MGNMDGDSDPTNPMNPIIPIYGRGGRQGEMDGGYKICEST